MKFFLLAAALGLAGCGRPATAPETPDGLTRVRLQLDWHPQIEVGGYYQAQARGFYREAGLDVGILPGGPGVPVRDTVALGRVEMGTTDGNGVILAIARGMPLVIVAAEMQRNPQGLMFHRSHPLRTVGDLEGRTLVASAGMAWVEFLEKGQGLRFALQPNTADLTGFLADETVVRQCYVTQEPFFARERGAQVGTLLLADAGYDAYRVVYTSRTFAQREPEAVRRFVAASVRGWADLLHGEAAPAREAIIGANRLMTPAAMDFGLAALREQRLVEGRAERGEALGRLTRDRLVAQIEALQRLGLLGRPLTVDEVARFDFLPAAQGQ